MVNLRLGPGFLTARDFGGWRAPPRRAAAFALPTRSRRPLASSGFGQNATLNPT